MPCARSHLCAIGSLSRSLQNNEVFQAYEKKLKLDAPPKAPRAKAPPPASAPAAQPATKPARKPPTKRVRAEHAPAPPADQHAACYGTGALVSAPVPSLHAEEPPYVVYYEDVRPYDGGNLFDDGYDAYAGCIVPPPAQGLHANGVWM